jgi:hypothetical protein
MRLRILALTTLLAVTALGSVMPARAADVWRWHRRDAWREREWRRHEWRERAWRERYYVPPGVVVRPYGYYAPPPTYYPPPHYYR